MSDTTLCNKCGQINPAGTAFCIHCGMPLFDLEDLNEEGLEKLLQNDDETVAEEDFISGVCKKCGAVLDIAKDVQQVTCPLCGTAHDVVYQYGEAMLVPVRHHDMENDTPPSPIADIEPALEPEADIYQDFRIQEPSPEILPIQVEPYQDINIIEQIRSEQGTLAIRQQIFDLEQRVRENHALIQHQGTTEGDIRNGVVGLLVSLLLGILAEVLLQHRLGYTYEHGLVYMLSTLAGVVWMVWCWFTSRFPTAQEGSRLVKENQRLETQIRSFRSSIDLSPSQESHPFREMLCSIQIPKRKRKKQAPWTCTNCGSTNDGTKRTCSKCGTVHKQPMSLKGILLIAYFVLMGLCMVLLALTWFFASLFDFLPIQARIPDTYAEQPVEGIQSPEDTHSTSQAETAIITESGEKTDCLLWADVSPEDIGKTLCVFGQVYDRYQGDSNHYYIRFNDDYESFRMIIKVAPDALVPAFDEGECIYQTGKISSYGDLTYMDVSAPVARCKLK